MEMMEFLQCSAFLHFWTSSVYRLSTAQHISFLSIPTSRQFQLHTTHTTPQAKLLPISYSTISHRNPPKPSPLSKNVSQRLSQVRRQHQFRQQVMQQLRCGKFAIPSQYPSPRLPSMGTAGFWCTVLYYTDTLVGSRAVPVRYLSGR